MSEGAKRLKANRQMAGQGCGWCGVALALAEDTVLCTPCRSVHHTKCWRGHGGCRTEGCVNAPLVQLEDAPIAAAPVAGGAPGSGRSQIGKTPCPHCGYVNRTGASICKRCHQIPTPDGVYRGPTTTAPGASASLVFGILAFFICGIIFGILAITKSNEAMKHIQRDPRYTGKGMAVAGRVLGIVALALWALLILISILSN